MVALVWLLVAVGATVAAVRGCSYAMCLGMPLVAAVAPRLFEAPRLRTLVTRLAAALLLTPMAVSAGAITIAHASGFDDADSFARSASRACFESANYAPLARPPAGLVVAGIGFGPCLLALTPHNVMAAPYHRLGRGIVAAHSALASPPEKARSIPARIKANHVVLCGPRPPDGLGAAVRERSLWARLQAGTPPTGSSTCLAGNRSRSIACASKDRVTRQPEGGQVLAA